MKMITFIGVIIPFAMSLAIELIIAFILMVLWNWQIINIFDLEKINYYQSIALLFISNIFTRRFSYKSSCKCN